MADVAGLQILNIGEGGSVEAGREIGFKMEISDGKAKQTLTLFAAADLVPLLVSKLMTFAGVARDTRMKANPREEMHGTLASGLAMNLAGSYSGTSISQAGTAVLTLQFATDVAGQTMPVQVAATAPALQQLEKTCQDALAALQQSNKRPKPLLDS